MARLPTVGGDRDNWGVVLNDYLSVEHNSDGTLKLRSDGSLSDGIADGTVTAAKLSSTVNNYLASAQTAVQSVNGESGQAITLTASDVSAIATSAAGAASGVATLDGSSKLTASQVPTGVLSDNDIGTLTEAIAQPAFQELLAIMEADTGSARLLVIGDSTGNATDEWVYLLATALGARYPAFDVDYHLWNSGGDAYDAAIQIQSGTGSNALTVYNCSVAAWNTFHAQGTGTWSKKVSETAAHAVIVSLGHNHGSGGAVPPHAWYTDLSLLTEEIARALPMAGLACIAQNPRTTDSDMDARRLQTMRWTRAKGYGFIDVCAAFNDSDTALADLLQVDGIHPNAAGSAVWRDEVLRHFAYDQRAVARTSQRQSSFDSRIQNLLVNGDFGIYHGAATLGTSGFVSGSPVVHITAGSSELGLVVGAYVTGSNIPSSTLITAIQSRVITIGDITNLSTSLTNVRNVTGLVIGQRISGTGIPASTTISSISGHTITMSAAATATTSNLDITFQAHITMNKNATGTANATLTQASGFAYWEASNCTVVKDTTNYESLPPSSGGASPGTGWACQLTQVSGATPAYIRQTIPAQLLLGRQLFYSARVRRNSDATNRMRIYSDQIGGTAIAGLDVPSGPSGDVFSNALLGFSSNYIWVGNRYYVSPDATSFQVFIYVAAGTSETGAVGQVDRAVLRAAVEPGDVRRALIG